MYLFVDTLSDPAYVCLFNEARDVVDSSGWSGKHRDFDLLIDTIDQLLAKNTLPYSELSGIVTIVGPGSFTGTRINTLVANTLSHSFDIPLFPITVGDFFGLQNAPLPWIVGMTKKEVLLWDSDDRGLYKSVVCADLPPGLYTASTIDFESDTLSIYRATDYASVIRNISLEEAQKTIFPLYAKDPNITLRK